MAKVFGYDVDDIDNGEIPVGGIVIVKTFDGEGESYIIHAIFGSVSDCEAVGMLTMVSDLKRHIMVQNHYADEDDD